MTVPFESDDRLESLFDSIRKFLESGISPETKSRSDESFPCDGVLDQVLVDQGAKLDQPDPVRIVAKDTSSDLDGSRVLPQPPIESSASNHSSKGGKSVAQRSASGPNWSSSRSRSNPSAVMARLTAASVAFGSLARGVRAPRARSDGTPTAR